MKRHIRKNKVIRAIKIIEIEATLLITEVIWLLLLLYCRAAGPLDIVWKQRKQQQIQADKHI